MSRSLVALQPAQHRDWCWRAADDFRYAMNVLWVPFVMDELAEVARSFPIVFPAGVGLPAVLMGVEAGGNAYVDEQGGWRAPYVPAVLAQHPFALSMPPADATPARPAPVLLGETGTPLLGPDVQGEPVFTPQGHLSPVLHARVASMLKWYQRMAVTRPAVQVMEQFELLQERPVRVQRANGQQQVVAGLRVVHEARLNQLDEAGFLALRRAGALPLVYAHLLSWAHFEQGPIGQAHTQPTAATAVSGAVAASIAQDRVLF